ncbi:ankyrin repeat-containing protein bda1 [Quercus suber]|uniref:Ankyrin repeat-containing protein bda1 n=1 Tax=Quercus suber TaxID=58331 RepID=A0AAW0LM99_QUESU
MSETPLHISTLVGHLDFSRALLLLKPQLAIELDSHKRCPLHMASAEGHIEIVHILLRANNKACLIRDQDERIPLHYAVMRGRIDVVRELITAQPDLSQIFAFSSGLFSRYESSPCTYEGANNLDKKYWTDLNLRLYSRFHASLVTTSLIMFYTFGSSMTVIKMKEEEANGA